MKKSTMLVTFAVLFALASVQAYAYPLPINFQIKFTDFEYINNPNIDWNPTGSSVQIFTGLADGEEDNWGIARVTSIGDRDQGGANVWSEGQGNEYLTVMFWGFDVYQITAIDTDSDTNPDLFKIFTQAASTTKEFFNVPDLDADGNPDAGMAIYLENENDFDESLGPSARTAADQYPNVTDGTLQALFKWSPSVATAGQALTVISSNSLTVPLTGEGSGYLDVIAGSGPLADLIVAGAQGPDGIGGYHDLFVKFNVRTHPDAAGLPNYGWSLNSEDPAFGKAVPEPASMILLGSGLTGLGGVLGRFKRKRMSP